MKMNRNCLAAYVLLLLAVVCPVQAQNATAILDKAAGLFENSNGLRADFTLQTRAVQQGISESFDGVLDINGDQFLLKTPDMQVWFDGKTQWAYVERNDEVNVTTPTGEELQMTNPAALLRNYKKGFNVKYEGECTAPNGKSAYTLVLTPKKKSDIEQVEILIEKNSGWPAAITIEAKNDIRNSIRISQIETGLNQPDSFFVFNENDYPGVEIIDLR